MAADALLRHGVAKAALVLGLFLPFTGTLGAQCGSAVIGEKAQPVAIQGLGTTATVRVWAAGSASSASITDPCTVGGCAAYDSSTLCDAGGACVAVTGIQWLNGSCATAGLLPVTTVVLAEDVTAGDGGRWAAVVANHNPGDANTDLDAAQDRICGGCSSVASPLIGDAQHIGAGLVGQSGDLVTLGLSWSEPYASAQALGERATSLVTGYSIWVARAPEGSVPALNGDTTGWTRAPDLDTVQTGGYSTDTAAEIVVDLAGSTDAVWGAVGLIFDGSGDPASDTNSLASNVISRGIQAYVPSIGIVQIFTDGFESGNTTKWSDSSP
jgi:hypothetical protein